MVFKFKNGKLEKYTSKGRMRKNWRSFYRCKSRKFLKERCEICLTNIIKLTIHHETPLNSAKTEEQLNALICKENCKTLCLNCHIELEREKNLEKNNSISEII